MDSEDLIVCWACVAAIVAAAVIMLVFPEPREQAPKLVSKPLKA